MEFLEEENFKLGTQLIEANEKNTIIITKISHELRNPLATIITAISLIEQKIHMGYSIEKELQIIKHQCSLLLILADELYK